MKSKSLEVMKPLAPEQAKRVERIKTYHDGTINAFRNQMGYAFLAGVELIALKESCNGDFTKTCDQELAHIPHSSRQRYMKFAGELMKLPTVGNLAKQPNLITNGEIAEKDKSEICKAVHQVADGKSLTELYRDLGVIRPAKKPGDVEHVKPRKLSLAEQHAQQVDLAQKDWAALDKQLLGYGPRFTFLEDVAINAQVAHLEAALSARKQWLATPKKDRDEKKIAKLFKVTTKGSK